MAKRSENKDRVFKWLSEHSEAVTMETLKPLYEAFPGERKQNLSSWRKEYKEKGLNIIDSTKTNKTGLNRIKTNEDGQKKAIPAKIQDEDKKQSTIESIKPAYIVKDIKENSFYTVEQASELLQVDNQTFYKLIKSGIIPALNINTTGGNRGLYRVLGRWLLDIKPNKKE